MDSATANHHDAAAADIRAAFEKRRAELGMPPSLAPATPTPPVAAPAQSPSVVDMRKLLEAVTTDVPASPPPAPSQAAASPELVMRAPDLTAETILQISERVAQEFEALAEAVMQHAIGVMADARDKAKAARDHGALQAASITGYAKVARETVHMFAAQHAKVTGQPANITVKA